ncbi:leucine-rich repeat protein [bacterium]|nr:MAG: leucine-rich repeat protein [bacterium]
MSNLRLTKLTTLNRLTSLFKRTNYLALSLIISLTSILPILLPASANAAPSTPPDSCFNFDSGTGTITDYYDYEGNNNSNPACTREPIIPGTIGGNVVTVIGSSAFSSKQLTSVTIGNSVTSIDEGAFAGNQLTSVIIGNSVASIGGSAFNANMLETVTLSSNLSGLTSGTIFTNNKIQEMQIPDSITLIDTYTFFAQSPIGAGSYYAFMNNDYSALNQYMATSWYARLFTSPGNPNNLTDSYAVESVFGMDMNSDGDMNDSIGGHLINPSRVTTNYKDTNGNTIAPSTTATGTGLSSYLAVDNPTNNLSLYYKAGNSYTVPPAPFIPGYTIQTTPSNIASLTAGNNSIDYIYTANSNNEDNTLSTPLSNSTTSYLVLPDDVTNPSFTTTPTNTIPSDTAYSFPTSLVSFQFDTTPGSTKAITLYFDLPGNPSDYTARKYDTNNHSFSTIASATITRETYNNKSLLKLTYNITDGDNLDQDHTVNGTIIDPVGLATNTVGAPQTGVGRWESSWVATILSFFGL